METFEKPYGTNRTPHGKVGKSHGRKLENLMDKIGKTYGKMENMLNK